MTDERVKVILGGLLHDVGKVVYRAGAAERHSLLGEKWLKEEGGIKDQDILDQVQYHHGKELAYAKLEENSLAYITYIADNISAGLDRRKETDVFGYEQGVPLVSIFSHMNGDREEKYYPPSLLDVGTKIAYPSENKISCGLEFYDSVLAKLKDCLAGLEYNEDFIESFQEVLESVFTYVPSSTSRQERGDISLYDHSKLTAAVGSCIHAYLKEKGQTNYKQILFEKGQDFYETSAFFLYSMDISGIQEFIYTTASDKVLKALRVRSFYLEILLEHCVDELLFSLGLSRCNLLYSGGGHAYMLLPGTAETEEKIHIFEKKVNRWFLDNFKTALFLGVGYAKCSANTLMNQPGGSYGELFHSVSEMISKKKLHRYNAEELIWLNKRQNENHERECKICHRSDRLVQTDKCSFCAAVENMSSQLLKKDLFVVMQEDNENCLPLPFGCVLKFMDRAETLNAMKSPGYVKTYGKNQIYTGLHMTKLWVADYASEETFEDLKGKAVGTKKIAVLRADVDDLGKSFIHGFEDKTEQDKYVTLSRTATFSRKMSMYFKKHINSLLECGENYIVDKETGKRTAVVVYAGGDDLFIVGSWDDIIGFSLDLYESFQRYTQGSLSFSAGIGIYDSKFPVANMAEMTGDLEDYAKSVDGKNAVTLFEKNNTYSWPEFQNKVIREKYKLLNDFFEAHQDKGRGFLYELLELFQGVDTGVEQKINLARLAYLLGRIQQKEQKNKEKHERLYQFSEQIYQWIKDKEDRRQMITAIYLYAYKTREME